MIDIPCNTDQAELNKDGSFEVQNNNGVDINRILEENDLIYKSVRESRRIVEEAIEQRKSWTKFGQAKNDPPGPNPANTFPGEEIFMNFLTRKQKEACMDEDPLASKRTKLIKCRNCQGDHWTRQCPLNPPKEENELAAEVEDLSLAADQGGGDGPDKNVGKQKKTFGNQSKYKNNKNNNKAPLADMFTIKVTNISKDASHTDLKELFKEYDTIRRIFLVMDKETGISKGVAFISFADKAQAGEALKAFSGYEYYNLYLKVNWARDRAQPPNRTFQDKDKKDAPPNSAAEETPASQQSDPL